MQTVIKSKAAGTTYKFITQQYEIGLYVAVYSDNRIIDQYGTKGSAKGLPSSEETFHVNLRRKAEKIGDEVVEDESTKLDWRLKNGRIQK